MAEITLEKKLCEKCGADVRPNTLFCYNCGSQVASDEEVALENSKAPDAINKIAQPKKFETTKLDSELIAATTKNKVKASSIPKPTDSILAGENEEDSKRIDDSSRLKTASSLRNKPKTTQSKQIKVTWDSYESAPNIWFLLVALILTLFAAGILYAMLQIR